MTCGAAAAEKLKRLTVRAANAGITFIAISPVECVGRTMLSCDTRRARIGREPRAMEICGL